MMFLKNKGRILVFLSLLCEAIWMIVATILVSFCIVDLFSGISICSKIMMFSGYAFSIYGWRLLVEYVNEKMVVVIMKKSYDETDIL